jgi:hypothetical protein
MNLSLSEATEFVKAKMPGLKLFHPKLPCYHIHEKSTWYTCIYNNDLTCDSARQLACVAQLVRALHRIIARDICSRIFRSRSWLDLLNVPVYKFPLDNFCLQDRAAFYLNFEVVLCCIADILSQNTQQH